MNKEENPSDFEKPEERSVHINPQNISKFKRKKYSLEAYLEGIFKGNRVILSQAITLLESHKTEHQELAEQIIAECLKKPADTLRIGITGAPGVGKSTFIENFGKLLIAKGFKVAVLAVDPSSQLSHGSILGDKTRMQELSVHPSAFVRPSPAEDSLGGVARKTRETIFLCEAAGFNVIIVETVGVGQSETAVHSMVDFFLLLLLPNAGDELQGIKRGVVEMADLIAVNKSDGPAFALANLAKAQYRNALHLFPPKANGWIPDAELCSGQTGAGLEEILKKILAFKSTMLGNSFWKKHRSEQARYWLHESISQHLKSLFYENSAVTEKLAEMENAVENGQLSSFKAADLLLKLFLKNS